MKLNTSCTFFTLKANQLRQRAEKLKWKPHPWSTNQYCASLVLDLDFNHAHLSFIKCNWRCSYAQQQSFSTVCNLQSRGTEYDNIICLNVYIRPYSDQIKCKEWFTAGLCGWECECKSEKNILLLGFSSFLVITTYFSNKLTQANRNFLVSLFCSIESRLPQQVDHSAIHEFYLDRRSDSVTFCGAVWLVWLPSGCGSPKADSNSAALPQVATFSLYPAA